jgi:hypothetical protein
MVQVVDTLPPTVNCPEPIEVECAGQSGTLVTFNVAAVDSCDPAPRVTCVPPSGSLFPLGQSAVICTAADAGGNRSKCSFTVNVVDRTPPTIACPQPIVAQCMPNVVPPHKPPGWPPGSNPPPNGCTALITYDPPQASDSCQTAPVLVICDPPSGVRLGLGTHTITCTARDVSGNEASCQFTVDVVPGVRAFIRGDTNADSLIDIADPVKLFNFLFLGHSAPPCRDAADSNDSGIVDMSDGVYELAYIYNGGPRPPEPYLPLCNLDPTDQDGIGCARYLPCE